MRSFINLVSKIQLTLILIFSAQATFAADPILVVNDWVAIEIFPHKLMTREQARLFCRSRSPSHHLVSSNDWRSDQSGYPAPLRWIYFAKVIITRDEVWDALPVVQNGSQQIKAYWASTSYSWVSDLVEFGDDRKPYFGFRHMPNGEWRSLLESHVSILPFDLGLPVFCVR